MFVKPICALNKKCFVKGYCFYWLCWFRLNIYSVQQQRHPVFTEWTFSHPVKGNDLPYITPCVQRHVSLDMTVFCSTGSVKEQVNARDHINFTFSTIYIISMWVYATTFIFILSFRTVCRVNFDLRYCYSGKFLFCF